MIETTAHEEAAAWSRVEGTLMATARILRKAYDDALAPIGINLSEASVLAYLANNEEALTQVQVAARMKTSRARIGAYVDSLEARGAVVRDRDPSDRRVWRLRLTPEGTALWLQAVTVDRAVRRSLRSGLTRDELDTLDGVLARIQSNLDKSGEGS
jgi:DNA-binding MarR family transcriptional regulator